MFLCLSCDLLDLPVEIIKSALPVGSMLSCLENLLDEI